MFLITLLMYAGGPGGFPRDPLRIIPLILTLGLLNFLFYSMVRTGRTDRYRAVFFVTMAALFVVSFLAHYQEARGSMSLSEGELIKGRTPFCHMVIPQTALVAALNRTIIFPGSMTGQYAAIASMLVIWIGASLALGRGFCAWGCFFGGMEDGFSRILKRARIRKIDPKWTYMPYAVLAVTVLASTALLSPFYCEWLCPFKTVTEYPQIQDFKTILQAVIFVGLFLGLVVVLPILTKKRTQCGLFCPMGAFQSFTNHVNAFDIRIDRSLCRDCGACTRVCPTFSLPESSVAGGKTRQTCVKCGKCVDACPHGAAVYHIRGTEVNGRPGAARMLFLYPAFLFLVIFGSGSIMDGLYRILLLVTTGSLLK